VADPACGEGVFLAAAAERISVLGGKPSGQIFGVEIDRAVCSRHAVPLLSRLGVRSERILLSDFFDVAPSQLAQVNAIVGNPPFIRYQTFRGHTRERALEITRRLGAPLSELASSWAPFLLHATEFLLPGGRLAMVVPAEITHAGYARPVIQFLTRKFGTLLLASFSQRLFPDLSQDTLLLFADNYGGQCRELRMKRFQDIAQLRAQLRPGRGLGARVSVRQLETTNGRLRNHFLPREVGALYSFLAAGSRVCRIGEIAAVGIGYVTGGNDYFHLSEAEAQQHGIPTAYLRPTLLRAAGIQGLVVSREDWRVRRDRGDKVFLLSVPRVSETDLPRPVRAYLSLGHRQEVHTAYKCAVRTPWFSVPHSVPAHAFLTYMAGDAPRVAWNQARLLATNSLHEFRLRTKGSFDAWKVALNFCSTLSLLSSEIEGHPMGGGMLKLEPSEAERILLVQPDSIRATRNRFEEIDTLVRAGQTSAATDLADEIILRDLLALTWDQIQVLREGLREIRDARRKRLAPSKSH
jgi:hypothetical protein